MDKEAPFFIASFANLLPSNFFPLTAKNISFFFNSFELIDAFLILILLEISVCEVFSFKIFTLRLFDKNLFFLYINFKIYFLS